MADQVELEIKSPLAKVIADLKKIQETAEGVNETLKTGSKESQKEFNKQNKTGEMALQKLGQVGHGIFQNLKDDFRSLMSIEALKGGMKLSNQFKDSVKEGIDLADTIRRLGPVFGIAKSKFADFQEEMVKGLGQIGLSSTVASEALKSLSDTQVRNKDALIEYSKAAGMLASVGGEKGREGETAKQLALTVKASGRDPNDVKAMRELAEAVRKAHNVSGMSPTEILKNMNEAFQQMPEDLRKVLSPGAVAKIFASARIAGPQAMDFMKMFMKMSPIQRKAMEAQGFKGIIGPNGLDIEKMRKALKSLTGRVGFDPRLAAQTLGVSEELAEGLVRMSEGMDKVKEAQEGMEKQIGDLESQYRETMSVGDAFRANLNRVKASFAKPISVAMEKIQEFFNASSKSDAGAKAVVVGGGFIAALLAGGGLKGLGKTLFGGGGLAKSKLIEEATGRQVQPVYVVNAEDMVGGGGLGGADPTNVSKIGQMFKGILGVTGAAAGGWMVGSILSDLISENTQGKTQSGYEGDVLDRLVYAMAKAFGSENAKKIDEGLKAEGKYKESVKLQIDLKSPNLKQVEPGTRGPKF